MPAFPNSDVYLNHLPPAVITQLEVARNLTILTLGVSFLFESSTCQ